MTRVFLVERQSIGAYSGLCNELQENTDHGTRVPVALFHDRPTAEVRRDRLMREAVRLLNPFHIYAECNEVLLDEDTRWAVFHLGIGTDPPESDWFIDWALWYDRLQPTLTDAQRVAVWGLFAARPLYEVVPIEMED